jgi:glycosyltransferase involved in cell wall biosynthesis
MPDISVVIPVYNAERYVGSCIEAFLSQDYSREKYEILIVDNGSTDASADIIERYPDITLLFEDRHGAYAARNRGIAEADGAIVAFTDPDCVPCPDWLSNIAATMSSLDAKIVVGYPLPAGDSPALSMIAAYENVKNEYIFGSNDETLYYGYANNMAIRRELFEELGPFLERRRGSDTILVRNVVERYSCNAVRYHPEIRVRHMEFDSLMAYWQKRFVYGRSRRRYRKRSYVRSLGWHERALVFRRTVRRQKHSLTESLYLLCLLAATVACWNLGYWTAAASRSASQTEDGVA